MNDASNSQDQQKMFEKGLALFSTQKYSEAIPHFETLTLSSLEIMKNYYLGMSYVKLNQLEKGLTYYRKIIEISRTKITTINSADRAST